MNRTIFHVAFAGLVVAPGVALAQERAVGAAAEVRSTVGGVLPPIRSAGDGAFGKPPVRAMSLDEVVKEIGKLDAAGSWRLNKQWEVIINSLVSAEIPQVLEAVEKMRVPGPQEQLRNAIFSRWGETDPAAAMARALAMTDLKLREVMRRLVLNGWAYVNPAEVKQWASELPEGPVKDDATAAAIGTLTDSLRPTDHEARSAGSQRLPASIERGVPAAVVEAGKIPQTEERIQAYLAAAKYWALQAPREAAAWALTLPIGREREIVLGAVMEVWSKRDRAGQIAFLSELPPTPIILETGSLTGPSKTLPRRSPGR